MTWTSTRSERQLNSMYTLKVQSVECADGLDMCVWGGSR